MSRRLITALVAAAATVVITASLAIAAPPRGYQLEARLTGAQEVPGPGDPDGTGTAYLDMRRRGKVCFRLSTQNIAPPTAGHIHQGARGVAGPVRVTLFTGSMPTGRKCVNAARRLKLRIQRNPGRWYVNVHNTPYPDGAVRAQLKR
jgi:CHRD domain